MVFLEDPISWKNIVAAVLAPDRQHSGRMEARFACTTPGCEEVFSSTRARCIHNRRHREFYKMKYPDGREEVLYKEDEVFLCPVETCLQSFSRGDSVKRHYYSIHVDQVDDITRVHPSDLLENQGLCITPDPSHTPRILLDAHLCVVHHQELLLLICTMCHSTISLLENRDRFIHHVQHHRSGHSRGRPRSSYHDDCEELRRALEGFEFTSAHDTSILPYTKNPESTLLPPVPGLVILNGFSCKICTYYCGVRRTICNHQLKYHRQFPIQDVAIECQVQMMFKRGPFGLRYFGVRHHNLHMDRGLDGSPSMADMITNEFVDHFLSLRVQMEPSVPELAPWLAESGWHEIAMDFMPKGVPFLEVKAQICPLPKADKSPLSCVRPMVLSYMDGVQDLLHRGVDYRLRRLVQKKSTDDQVTRGFNQLYVMSSRGRYSDVMTSFLLCLLRSFMSGRSSTIHIFHTDREDLGEAIGRLSAQLAELDPASAGDADLGILHEVMLAIWTPEIPKVFEATTSADCIVTRFLILESLIKVRVDARAEEYAFRHVRYLTQPMAMLKYWAKAAMIMHMGQSIWHESPQVLLNEEIDALLCYIRDVALPTPFNTVCQWLRLAQHITAGEPMLARLVPLDNTYSSCLLDGELITLTSFQEMVEAIILEAHTIMNRDVLVGMSTDWTSAMLRKNGAIRDDVNNPTPLYSFVTDPANRILQAHRNDLLLHLFNGCMKGHFILGRSDQNKIIWNEDSLRKWMMSCADFHERLTLLIHFLAALPSRGEEYKSFNMRNTATGNRTFFWEMLGAQGDTLMILQTYHKSANCGTPMKPTVKYVPLELRPLFLVYFTMVRPLQSYVAKILWGPEVALLYEDNWFVEMDRKLSGEDLSASIRNAFLTHCGVPFGLSEYRHLASFFSTRIREQHADILDDLVDVNGGHGTETVGQHYARSAKDPKHIDGHLMRGHQLVCTKWHRLARRSPPGSTQSREENMPHTPPVQVLHPRPTYTSMESPYKTRIVCQHVSPGASSMAKGIDESLVLVTEEVSMKAHLALRALGYETWRSVEQATSVALAMENKVDFMAILPTGAGKSLVFMAPSTMGEKTVIVVVPLKSLLYGHRTQCTKMGISHDTFINLAPLNAESAPSLVFVPVETAGDSNSNAFQTFANHLQAIGRLHSIVFDEIHTLQSTYRPVMKNLIKLMTVKCQIIGLTASLPPEAQVEVERILDSSFLWVRSATVRPNIGYMVVDVHDMNEEIVRCLHQWKTTTTSLDTDRAIVYCLTRQDVEATTLALKNNGLHCTHMHAGCSTAESVKSMKTWESKGCEILVATGVIGCGFHYSRVTLVIHKGGFRSLAVFHQESGRAGRDGLPATSCIVSNVHWRKEALCMDSTLEAPCKWIEEKERCRRIGLHAVVDGKPQMCYLIPGAVPCDHCSRGAQEQPVPMNVEETLPGFGPGRHGVPLPESMLGTTSRTNAMLDPSTTWRRAPQLQQNGLPMQAPTASQQTEIVSTIFHRVRPELTLGRIEEVRANIRLIRKYAGDHGRCLMCWSPRHSAIPQNHFVLRCPFAKNKCARCLQSLTHHSANACVNKIAFHADTCFRCHFPHQPDSLGFHQGPYGAQCQDTCGERLRLFMWKAWRYDNLANELFLALPEIKGFHDADLCNWLPSTHPGTLGNNFVRLLVKIVTIKIPEFR